MSSIPVPPTVYIDHDDVIVREGDSVTLECRAYAQPTPTIQWYKGRYAVVPSRRIATSSRGHLVINAVQQSDTGFYTCVALNIAGSDSVRVSFSVQGKHMIYPLLLESFSYEWESYRTVTVLPY